MYKKKKLMLNKLLQILLLKREIDINFLLLMLNLFQSLGSYDIIDLFIYLYLL